MGFQYRTDMICIMPEKDGGPDARGVGFYFGNITEIVLFGVRGN